jgi:hypothetical protein
MQLHAVVMGRRNKMTAKKKAKPQDPQVFKLVQQPNFALHY